MSIHLKLPTNLNNHTAGARSVDLEANNVGDLLDQLCIKFPTLRSSVFTAPDELSRNVQIFVNDEMIQFLQYLRTPLTPKDSITLIVGTSGG